MALGKNAGTSGAAPDRQPPQPTTLRDDVWTAKSGDLLRMLEMSPDDDASLVQSRESVDARLARDKAAYEAKWGEINRALASHVVRGSMQPFFLIPEPCWRGDTGTFLLVTLGLSPYESWNVAFLPTDGRTADMLDLPMHPNEEVATIIAACSAFLHSAMAHFQEIHAEAGRTGDVALFADRKDDIADRVRALAMHILQQYDDAWTHAAHGGVAHHHVC
jgi:hypothetical protein